MTPSEVETMLENLNTRTTAIEQILPTLATKRDLTAGLDGLEARLIARIDDASSGARVLCEQAKSDYKLLAEHLANVPTDIRELREAVGVIPELRDDIRRLTEQGAGVRVDIHRLTEQGVGMKAEIQGLAEQVGVIPSLRSDIRQLAESLARMSQDLGNRLDQLAQKIDSPRRRR